MREQFKINPDEVKRYHEILRSQGLDRADFLIFSDQRDVVTIRRGGNQIQLAAGPGTDWPQAFLQQYIAGNI